MSAQTQSDIDIFARTIMGEGQGGNLRQHEAVAAALINRLRRAGANASIAALCLAPGAYACWDAANPVRARILAATPAHPLFAACRRIAKRALAGALSDPVSGASHFHRHGDLPLWSRGKKPCALMGVFLFYNNVEAI